MRIAILLMLLFASPAWADEYGVFYKVKDRTSPLFNKFPQRTPHSYKGKVAPDVKKGVRLVPLPTGRKLRHPGDIKNYRLEGHRLIFDPPKKKKKKLTDKQKEERKTENRINLLLDMAAQNKKITDEQFLGLLRASFIRDPEKKKEQFDKIKEAFKNVR